MTSSTASGSHDGSGSAKGRSSPQRRRAGTLERFGLEPDQVPPEAADWLVYLSEENDRLSRELERRNDDLRQLTKIADADTLTPLLNRRAFLREVDRALQKARRDGGTISVIYLDLNGLKRINDTLGHAAGDAAISKVAGLLLKTVRAYDVVGRLGGDEFAVLLSGADEAAAHQRAETIVRTLEDHPLDWDGQAMPLSAAVGIAASDEGDTATRMVERADTAMYDNKRSFYARSVQ